MKITASLIAHFSLRARSMTMSNEASCGPLLIASFIAAIRCEEDYRRYIHVYVYMRTASALAICECSDCAFAN